jgi:hypothetical protein
MKTQDHALPADTRSPEQRALDEAVAAAAESGNWDGFETEELLTEEGARQLLEHCRTLDPNAVLAEVTKHPFRWKHLVFRLLRCEYADGEAKVEAAPHDPQFVAEVKKRIEQHRFHILPFYQGFGFISFPEDYSRYKNE